MKKAEFIVRYGKAKYLKNIVDSKDWCTQNSERQKASLARWRVNNPMKIKEYMKHYIKGGKFYQRRQIYQHTGLAGARNKIRNKHGNQWRQFKRIIAPDSQLHHQWRPQSVSYDGLAIVEADRHQHGIIDVIQILDGAITLFTEKEIREQGESGSAF